MDKPSIDSLLDNVPGMYELASIAAKRAIEIKRKDRENKQPLQQALDEIGQGNVGFSYRPQDDDALSGEQIELPLDLEGEPVKLADSAVIESADVDSTDADDDIIQVEESMSEPEDVDMELDVDVSSLDDDITTKLYKENEEEEDI